ncbi:MAG: 3-phosphoshikimate 1-carboxyvinyltransferase [Actinomycetota bacterium]|nr:3-phosphoshikimate 1-carboxyvinyltransferase [Actinomycetota bacterium]
MKATVKGKKTLSGKVRVPGDKSISHRGAIVGALARGTTKISGFSPSQDCASTLDVLGKLGVSISIDESFVQIEGKAGRFNQPKEKLHAGNSATTMRLLAGAIAPMPIRVTITGDDSLLRRPMGRIIEPLSLMGAKVISEGGGGFPPLTIEGGNLRGIEYSPPQASAQVKSAILLAGLGATGKTRVRELYPTRDHTERILRQAGVEVFQSENVVTLHPGVPRALELEVPGDISSAAFLLAGAMICPGSTVEVSDVGINPSRSGFLEIARKMGGDIEVEVTDSGFEPKGRITARYSALKGTRIEPREVARAIDEVMLVSLLATQAQGTTIIEGAGELRHKESDRLSATASGLKKLGARVEEREDGFVIEGPCELRGAQVDPYKDHRLAMMFAIAGAAASGVTVINDWEWIEVSYPNFVADMRKLGVEINRGE